LLSEEKKNNLGLRVPIAGYRKQQTHYFLMSVLVEYVFNGLSILCNWLLYERLWYYKNSELLVCFFTRM